MTEINLNESGYDSRICLKFDISIRDETEARGKWCKETQPATEGDSQNGIGLYFSRQ
jgi:hypothetical protein